jgi:hypothetical protein
VISKITGQGIDCTQPKDSERLGKDKDATAQNYRREPIPHHSRNDREFPPWPLTFQRSELMCVITPSGFEGFFEEISAMSPEEQQDIPRVMGIGGKYGLEFLPPES